MSRQLDQKISHGSPQGEFEHGKGTMLAERGPHNPIPVNNYLSGDGKSYVYTGMGYYVPSERRWIKYNENHSIPPHTRRDAILFESEDEWRKYQRARDKPSTPGGITLLNIPDNKSTTPHSALRPFQREAWNKPWTGSGYYVPPTNRWIHERLARDNSVYPGESYLFYNEEDWIKFRYQVENPKMKTS